MAINKGEARLGFLMSHVWVVLVVVVILTAVVMAGLWQFEKVVNIKVMIRNGIKVRAAKVDENSITIILENNLGKSLYDFQLEVFGCNPDYGTTSRPTSLIAEVNKEIIFHCTHDIPIGQDFKSLIGVSYKIRSAAVSGKTLESDYSSLGKMTVTVTKGKSVQNRKIIYHCGILNEPNTVYLLSYDIENNELTDNCLRIFADGIELDCRGHIIKSYNDVAGIFSNRKDTRIENCIIDMGNTEGAFGIYLDHTKNAYVFNNTLHYQSIGIFMDNAINSTVANNILDSNIYGLYLSSSSENRFSDMVINNNYYIGTLVSESSNNSFTNIETNSNTNSGFYLYLSGDNQISRISAEDNINGLVLDSAYNNSIANLELSYNSESGIFLRNSVGNIFNKGIISGTGNNGIWITQDDPEQYPSSDNMFRDMLLENSGTNDIYFITNNSGIALRNIFLNTNYSSDKVSFTGSSGLSQLVRDWYYRASVKDENGSYLTDAKIYVKNVAGRDIAYLTTNASGITRTTSLTDYTLSFNASDSSQNNSMNESLGGSLKTVYYSPYRISVLYPGGALEQVGYNITEEKNNFLHPLVLEPIVEVDDNLTIEDEIIDNAIITVRNEDGLIVYNVTNESVNESDDNITGEVNITDDIIKIG